jgi:putative heme-binding domain-containing protein
MIAHPSADHSLKVLKIVEVILQGFVSDRNFADLLRLTQVALHQGKMTATQIPELTQALVKEYPVGQPVLNRELFRILTYLNADEVIPAALATLQQDDLPFEERMNIAMHLSLFRHSWSAAERYQVVKFFEETQNADSGSSVPLYVMNLTRKLCADLSLEEARIFVSEGAKWPNAALVSLYRYPEVLSPTDLATLKKLDGDIDRKGFEGEQFKRLRTGIVAMLAQHGDSECQAYLREIWIRSPERRQTIALGLAQFPTEENWDYLIRSLPVLESFAVPEVMKALQKVPLATDDAPALREVILHGLRMEKSGESPQPALDLLKYWLGVDHSSDSIALNSADGDSKEMESRLSGWQAWFAQTYPAEPPAVLPYLESKSSWSIETIAEYLATSEGRKGNSEAGKEVYQRAQCADCHRAGSMGQSIGPDLTSVANRFTRKEVLESILFPSHVISDQYRSKRILTTDGKVLNGLLTSQSEGVITLVDSQANEITISEENVEMTEPSNVSMMPSGLIDTLSATEIRDLLTFLGFVPEQAAQVADNPETTQQR